VRAAPTVPDVDRAAQREVVRAFLAASRVAVDVLSDPTRLFHLDLGSPTAEAPTTEGAS
jgi:hypothetical protein